MGRRKRSFPDTYVIIAAIVVLAAVLTWIVPGGEFARETVEVNGVEQSVVVPGSFEKRSSTPQHIHIFPAVLEGMESTASIIFYILIIGGAFWVLNTTRALDTAIGGFLKYVERWKRWRLVRWLGADNIIVTLIMLGFSFLGSVIGMSEEVIPFVIIFVPLAIRMGYDSLVGLAMCHLAAGVGFAGSMLNPFSVGIAQGLAGLPLFSGLEYRVFIWLVLNAVSIGYILVYMRRLRANPAHSIMYEEDAHWREATASAEAQGITHATWATWLVYGLILVTLVGASFLAPRTTLAMGQSTFTAPFFPIFAVLWAIFGAITARHSVQLFNVLLLLYSVLLLVIGVMGYEWYISEIAALFLGMGLAAGIAFGYSGNELVKEFMAGARDILSAAMVVGIATAILVVLEDGRVIDTLLNGAANAMGGYGPTTSVVIMYIFYTLITLIIASSSAKAALTIPLMSQFGDLVGVSRQLTVTTFQLGHGFTTLATPISGVVIGVLGIARIPYVKFMKWYMPLLLIQIVVGFLLLLPPLFMEIAAF